MILHLRESLLPVYPVRDGKGHSTGNVGDKNGPWCKNYSD